MMTVVDPKTISLSIHVDIVDMSEELEEDMEEWSSRQKEMFVLTQLKRKYEEQKITQLNYLLELTGNVVRQKGLSGIPVYLDEKIRMVHEMIEALHQQGTFEELYHEDGYYENVLRYLQSSFPLLPSGYFLYFYTMENGEILNEQTIQLDEEASLSSLLDWVSLDFGEKPHDVVIVNQEAVVDEELEFTLLSYYKNYKKAVHRQRKDTFAFSPLPSNVIPFSTLKR